MNRQIFKRGAAIGAGVAVLALMALGARAQSAEEEPIKPEQVPVLVRAAPGVDASVRLCWFKGYLQDKDPAGTNLRAAPNARAEVLARVPNRRDEAGIMIAPEFQVIGSKDGWFLVRNMRWEGYDLPGAPIFSGTAWVSAALVGAVMEDIDLRQRPEPKSPLVMKLRGKGPDGQEWSAGDLKVQRMHGCSGSMVDVTFELPGKKTARGWASGACANQVTTCGGGHLLVHERKGALVPQESE